MRALGSLFLFVISLVVMAFIFTISAVAFVVFLVVMLVVGGLLHFKRRQMGASAPPPDEPGIIEAEYEEIDEK